MKVVLSGATGFIGSEVLRQCIAHPDITAIVCLARREIPEEVSGKSDKVHTVILKDHKDWSKWSEATRKAVEGADMALWYVFFALFPLPSVPVHSPHRTSLFANRQPFWSGAWAPSSKAASASKKRATSKSTGP